MRTVYGIDTYNYCKETDFSQLILNDGTQYFGICFISLPNIKIYTYYLLTRFTPHEVSSLVLVLVQVRRHGLDI